MLKVLVIGDPHFREDNVIESNKLTDEIIKLIEEKNPTFVVCLGDMMHNHKTCNMIAYNNTYNFINEIQSRKKLFILIGNHDRPNNSKYDNDEHFFQPYKYCENIKIVDEPYCEIIDEHKFTFMPYYPKGKFNDKLNELDWKSSTIIFTHQEFKGVKFSANKSKDGDVWLEENPLIINGHIHDYDVVQPNLKNIGTPYQHGYGDTCDKTVSLFHINETIEEERINLGFIKKELIYIKSSELDKFKPNPLSKTKLIIVGDEVEIKMVQKLDVLKKLKESGVVIKLKTTNKIINNKNYYDYHIRKRYLEQLFDEIKNDEHLIAKYNEVFN